jgi:hypothetical protein
MRSILLLVVVALEACGSVTAAAPDAGGAGGELAPRGGAGGELGGAGGEASSGGAGGEQLGGRGGAGGGELGGRGGAGATSGGPRAAVDCPFALAYFVDCHISISSPAIGGWHCAASCSSQGSAGSPNEIPPAGCDWTVSNVDHLFCLPPVDGGDPCAACPR